MATKTAKKPAAKSTTKTTRKPAAAKSTKAATKTTTKTTTAKPKAKPKAKAPVERDAFGGKPGTQAHAINAAITTTPQTVKQIAEKADAEVTPGRVSGHLRFLLGKGLIERTADGYAKPKAKRTRKTTK